MIVVLADDLTGAAELAGIGWRFGLKTTLYHDLESAQPGELVVINTDTRSMDKSIAIEKIKQASQKVAGWKPTTIFKKIDSVMRGYVLEETEAMLNIFGKQQAVIAPANPSLGRRIIDGEYWIHDQRITETAFKDDPEFPVTKARLFDMLGADQSVCQVWETGEPLTDRRLILLATADSIQMDEAAHLVGADALLVGAGDFFTSFLKQSRKETSSHQPVLARPHLYICGTAFKQRLDWIRELQKQKDCVCFLSELQLKGEKDDAWEEQAAKLIGTQGRLVIAVDDAMIQPGSWTAAHIRTVMAKVAKAILRRSIVKEIFIEGGSTAASVLGMLDTRELVVTQELERGVVRMRKAEYFVSMKPGSYSLPVSVKKLYE